MLFLLLYALLPHQVDKAELVFGIENTCFLAGYGAPESSMFDQWGGGIRELCERGFMNYVVQEQKAYCLNPDFEPINENTARPELSCLLFCCTDVL